MEKLKEINKCKKNICDIDKLLDIYNKNIDIKDKQIIKQLKSRKNKYIIELYDLTNNNYTLDNVSKITEMKIDYKNHSAFISYKMTDGSKNKQLYPVDKLLINKNGNDMYAFE